MAQRASTTDGARCSVRAWSTQAAGAGLYVSRPRAASVARLLCLGNNVIRLAAGHAASAAAAACCTLLAACCSLLAACCCLLFAACCLQRRRAARAPPHLRSPPLLPRQTVALPPLVRVSTCCTGHLKLFARAAFGQRAARAMGRFQAASIVSCIARIQLSEALRHAARSRTHAARAQRRCRREVSARFASQTRPCWPQAATITP